MVIVNGKIFPMVGKKIDCGYVCIKGKRITEVGEMSVFQGGNNEEILDVQGAWVLPGLIEAHAHIGITEEKWGTIGDDCNEETMPITPTLRAIDAVNPMDPAFHDAIEAGITSVMTGPGSANVVGGQFVFMKTQGRCVDNMIIKYPAAMKVAFGENPKTTYGGKDQLPSTRMGTAALLRKTLYKAWQYKTDMENGTLTQKDFAMEPWIPVLNREIPLKAHAHRADDILTAIRVAKEFQVDITTDHPAALIQYLPLCAGLAVKYGLPMEEGLKAITINAARICRVDDRVGSLKKGKDADIAVFSGNPMEVFTKTIYTIIDGQIVYKNKEKIMK